MNQDIQVQALARVEGEGGLYVGVEDDKIREIKLNIYEPPRFFEGFLRGRFVNDVPDITARICGICPVAYQMSSVRAIENAMGIEITSEIRALRRLFYCAEYVESHALHIYLLQAPDLLGHESGLSLAAEAPEVVKKALRLKKIGNSLLSAIGGRSVHPVSARVGGWYSWPDRQVLQSLIEDFEWALEFSKETARWAMTLPFPELEVDYEFVSQHHPDEYAFLEGDLLGSSEGVTTEADFAEKYLETHVQHSTALHSHTPSGNPYLVGPLARFNNNYEQLGEQAKAIVAEIGLELPLKNPYKSLIARAIELVDVCDEALRLLREYDPQGPSYVDLELKAGKGAAVTEAPRGLLYHSYEVDDNGLVLSAHIMPPTAQNLARIEADLWLLEKEILSMEHDEATLLCEELIRAYDPCISCSVHFLTLEIDRS